jgi:hypothetical protein
MFSKISSTLLTIITVLSIVVSLQFAGSGNVAGVQAKSNNQVVWGCAGMEPNYGTDFGCPSNVKLVTSPWILTKYETYHSDWLNLFTLTGNTNKTPYIHTYVIAGLARENWGLQDCNVDPINNLCYKGSLYLRQNESNILSKYTQIAKSIKANLKSPEVYIHIEPDYFQYTYASQQQPLNYQESWSIMNKISSIFNTEIPEAKLVLDISSWNYNLTNWCGGFTGFDYGGMVGKVFSSNENPDGQSYSKISTDCGYELVVNTAHGVAGYFNNYNPSWENNNQNVHALIQSPLEKNRYQSFLDSIIITTPVITPPVTSPAPSPNPTPVTSPAPTPNQNPDPSQNQLPIFSDPLNPNPKKGKKNISFFQDNETRSPEETTSNQEIITINGVRYYSDPRLEKLLEELQPVK